MRSRCTFAAQDRLDRPGPIASESRACQDVKISTCQGKDHNLWLFLVCPWNQNTPVCREWGRCWPVDDGKCLFPCPTRVGLYARTSGRTRREYGIVDCRERKPALAMIPYMQKQDKLLCSSAAQQEYNLYPYNNSRSPGFLGTGKRWYWLLQDLLKEVEPSGRDVGFRPMRCFALDRLFRQGGWSTRCWSLGL